MRRTWDPTFLAVLLAVALLVGGAVSTGGLGRDEWRASLDSSGRSVRFDVSSSPGPGRWHTFSIDADAGAIEGFDAATFEQSGAPLRLAWKRDAGTFVFEGEGGRRPRGKFRFEPDAGFVAKWQGLEFGNVSDGDLLRMAAHDVRLADAERLHELGYRGVDADEMIGFENRSISMEWVEGMQQPGYRPEIEDLFRLHAHGVGVDDVRAFAALGIQAIETDALLRLQSHGIEASYVRGMIDAGIALEDLDDMVRLHARGIVPDDVAELRSSGLPELDLDDVIRLHSQAIAPDIVAGLRASGLPEVGIDDVMRLHSRGITATYVRAMVDSGLPDLSVDAIVRLHAHGVSTDFARALVVAGPGASGAEAVTMLHDHGVEAAWVRGMAELGYGGLPPDELTRLHAHAVSPDFVRSLAQSGHRDLTVDQLIRAASRGPEALGEDG